MKRLITIAVATAALSVFAEVNKAEEAELVKNDAPIFWGFGNYGVYSGYQLYGSLVNNEPTLQGYFEGNANLIFNDWDFGYLGAGLWSNSDLTARRRDFELGNMFNEWDFNAHWGRTFWFDDNKTWGLTYRTSVVWYYYPTKNYAGSRVSNHTTVDWNHYFELQNPYLIPYINVVREYHESDANLLQFGVKKPFQLTDDLSICPFVEMVWRENRYNWCFPTRFGACDNNSGIATFKVECDATYMITSNFGLFAKIAYCSVIDPELRDNITDTLNTNEYGAYATDYVWGGVGVAFSF